MSGLPFEGKYVLITGSGRGIGRAMALHFARQGAGVVVNFFRNREPAEATRAEIEALGRPCLLVRADVGALAGVDTLFNEIEKAWGGLDILVSNAASGYNRPALAQKVKGWEWTMNANARAFLLCAQRAATLMEKRGGGAMVAISSPGATRVLMNDYVVVGASKAALEALVRYLAIELAPKNIVVNAVSPGVVETDALQRFSLVREDPELVQRLARRNPAGRLVTPEDVAQVVAFLCSPAAAMIRGQVLTVDGGETLVVRDK